MPNARMPEPMRTVSAAGWRREVKATLSVIQSLGGVPIAVHSVDGMGSCTCGDPHDGTGSKSLSTKSRGKHPVAHGWQNSTALSAADKDLIMAGLRNIGCSTGDDVIALDFDGVEGMAKLAEWDADERGFPRSARCITGSGGIHVYFQLPIDWQGVLRNSQSSIAKGVDVRAKGGQAVMPPSRHHSGGAYTWESTDVEVLPVWFIDSFLAKPTRRPVGELPTSEGLKITYSVDSPVDVLAVARKVDSWADIDGEGVAFQIGCYCRDHGLSESMAVDVMVGSAWNAKCSPVWSQEELAEKVGNSYRYADGVKGVKSVTAQYSGNTGLMGGGLVSHNQKVLRSRCGILRGDWLTDVNGAYSTLLEGSTLWVCFYANGVLRRIKPADWKLRMAGVSVDGLGKDGSPSPLGTVWFQHPHTEYTGVGMFPRVRDCPVGVLNTWSGFPNAGVGGGGSCEKFKWHVRVNMCDKDDGLYEWVMNWLAHMVQMPWHKPGTALILRSEKEGTGKGLFAEYVRAMIGDALTFKTSNPQDIIGTFNAGLDDKLFVVGDEILFKGNKAATDAVKSLITEPTMSIRRMRTDAQVRPSYVRVVLISNHDAVMDIQRSDARRMTVVDMDGAENSFGHVGGVWDEMADGGGAALFAELEGWEVDIKLACRPYQSAGLAKMRSAAMDLGSVEGWLADQLGVMGLFECGESGVRFVDVEGESDPQVVVCHGGTRVVMPVLYKLYARATRDRFTTANSFGRKVGRLMGTRPVTTSVGGVKFRTHDFVSLEGAKSVFCGLVGARVFDE